LSSYAFCASPFTTGLFSTMLASYCFYTICLSPLSIHADAKGKQDRSLAQIARNNDDYIDNSTLIYPGYYSIYHPGSLPITGFNFHQVSIKSAAPTKIGQAVRGCCIDV